MSGRILYVVSLLCALLVVRTCSQPTLRVTTQTQNPNVWVLECRPRMATLILDRGGDLEEISLSGEYPLQVTPEEEVTASCRVGVETSVPIMLAAIQRYNSSLPRNRDQDVYLNQEAEIDCPFEFGRLSKSLVPYEISWVRERLNQRNIPVDEDPESEGFSLNGSTLILPITTFSSKSYFCKSNIQLCNNISQCPSPDQQTGPTVNLNVLGFNVTAQPQSQNVTLDEPATFSCSAHGRGDFKIKWMYAGVEYEPEESDCEDGGVCVTENESDYRSLRQVDSTITIPSNMIVESEQVVQCRVTLGMSQTEMYNATLGCSHCVTTTTSTTTEDTTTEDISIGTASGVGIPVEFAAMGVVLAVLLVAFVVAVIVIIVVCYRSRNTKLVRKLTRSFSRDPRPPHRNGVPGRFIDRRDTQDNGTELYADVLNPELIKGTTELERQNGVPFDEGAAGRQVLFSPVENVPQPRDPTTMELIYNNSQGGASACSGFSGVSQSGPGPHPMPTDLFPPTDSYTNLSLSQPHSDANGSHLCPPPWDHASGQQPYRKISDPSIHSRRSGRSAHSAHSGRSAHSAHSGRSGCSAHSGHSGHSGRSGHSRHSSNSGHSSNSAHSAYSGLSISSHVAGYYSGSEPRIHGFHHPYHPTAHHSSHNAFNEIHVQHSMRPSANSRSPYHSSSHDAPYPLRYPHPNPADVYPPPRMEYEYPQKRADYSSHPHLYQHYPPPDSGRHSPAHIQPVQPLEMLANAAHDDHHPISEQALCNVLSCLMHNKNCQISQCPCSKLKERFHHLLADNFTLHTPEQNRKKNKVVSDSDDAEHPTGCASQRRPNLLPMPDDDRPYQHIPNLHPHYHLTEKSHLRHVLPKDTEQKRRSKSMSDLTPVAEVPETPAKTPRVGGSLIAGTPVRYDSPGMLGENCESSQESADRDFAHTCSIQPKLPALLRERSMSADNLPALCLNDCPLRLTPSPQKGVPHMLGTATYSHKKKKPSKPSLKTVDENNDSQETDDSNTSSRSPTPPLKSSQSDTDDGIEVDASTVEDSILSELYLQSLRGQRMISRGESSGYESSFDHDPNSGNNSRCDTGSLPRKPPLSNGSSLTMSKLASLEDSVNAKHSISPSVSSRTSDRQSNRLHRSPTPYETDTKSENGVTVLTTEC